MRDGRASAALLVGLTRGFVYAGARWARPFFWAGFTIQGDWRQGSAAQEAGSFTKASISAIASRAATTRFGSGWPLSSFSKARSSRR